MSCRIPWGQRAEDEPQSEDKQARYEDLLPAYDVSGAAYGEQRTGDGELVGESDPHDDGGGGIEDTGERGEGDGDDAGVHGAHERRGAHRRQGPPLVGAEGTGFAERSGG